MTKTTCIRKKDTRVYYRIFPIEHIESKYAKLDRDKRTIFIRNRQDLSKNSDSAPKDYIYWKFNSDGVFRNNSQKNIYATIIEDVLPKVLKGSDAIILGFGQTGSGKSSTIGGLHDLPQDIGIAPRLINEIFEIKNAPPKNLKLSLQMSYMEYGKQNAFDLLREYPNSVEYPFVMTKLAIKSKTEAYKYLFKGEGRKEFISNAHMSHLFSSVLTIFVTLKNVSLETPYKFSTKIHLLDLAGTDTSGNMSCAFKSALDVGNANLIKSNLEEFVMCLCENIPEKIKVKHRMNPIINYLGGSLNNEAILRFIGHINLSPENMMITLSLLRFGQIVKGLKMKPKVVIPEMNPDIELTYYKNELKKLREQRQQRMIFNNQVTKLNIDKERILQIERAVREYVRNESSVLDLISVTEVKATYEVFKNIYQEFDSEKAKIYKEAYNAAVEDIKQKKLSISNTSKQSLRSRASKSSMHSETARQKQPMSSDQFDKAKTVSEGSVKKKSTVSLGSKKESKRSIKSADALIPDKLPEYEEIWEQYVNDKSTKYSNIYEEYKNNEAQLQETYITYMDQMKLLDKLRNIIETRERELMEIKITNNTSTEPEDLKQAKLQDCINNLQCAKRDYLLQEERTITCKASVQIYLNMRLNLKNLLNDDFRQYCSEHLDMPVLNLGSKDPLASDTVDLDNIQKEEPQECEAEIKKTVTIVDSFEKLKNIMNKEIEKKNRYNKTHKFLFKY